MKRLSWSVALACWLTSHAAGAPPPPPPSSRPAHRAAEAVIHPPPGFAVEGKPKTYAGADAASLQVTVVDSGTGRPTFCRVNVVGSDGNFYQPKENTLAPWSLHRTGNRLGKGP